MSLLEPVGKEIKNDTRSRKVNFEFGAAGFSDRVRTASKSAAAQMDRGESECYIWKRSKRSVSNKHA
jgi:hypothetical protein